MGNKLIFVKDIPLDVLHNEILVYIPKDCVLVCKEWNRIHFPNILSDTRINPCSKGYLYNACYNGCERTVKLILQYYDKLITNKVANISKNIIPSYEHLSLAFRKPLRMDIIELIFPYPTVQISKYNNHCLVMAVITDNMYLVEKFMNDVRCNPTLDIHECLYYASICGFTDIVKFFLNDPRTDVSQKGNRAIIGAERFDRRDIIDILMDHPTFDISADNFSLIDCLYLNAKSYVLRKIMSDPKFEQLDKSIRDSKLLCWSVLYDSVSNVKTALRSPNINPSCMDNKPLRLAINSGNIEIMELLLDDPRIDLFEGEYILLYACSKAVVSIVRTLLSHSNINPDFNNNQPLSYCIENNIENVAKFLSTFSPETNKQFNRYITLKSRKKICILKRIFCSEIRVNK